jgi:hypothetical protein
VDITGVAATRAAARNRDRLEGDDAMGGPLLLKLLVGSCPIYRSRFG